MSEHLSRRLFFALPIDDALRESLEPVHEELLRHRNVLSVVSPENYHITVKFLGSVGEDTCQALIREFRALTGTGKSIPCRARGLGAFPAVSRARVIWCAMDTDIPALAHIREKIEELASSHGFDREIREFRPHLTLARVRKKERVSRDLTSFIENNRETLYGESSFSKLVLYESLLTRDGARYTELNTIPLV